MNPFIKSAPLALTFAAALFSASAAWAVNTITTITPSSDRVVLVDGKATVRFMVAGQGNEESDCGIWVTYGDNDSPDTRVIGRREGMFPREFVHTFAAPGQYTVTAKGQRVKQTFACNGEALTTINVVDRGGARRRAGAECPAGWRVTEGSFMRETGAFTCTPAYPEARLDCGPGLRYFERDGLIGCRVRNRDR
jgi:hypothetical protein